MHTTVLFTPTCFPLMYFPTLYSCSFIYGSVDSVHSTAIVSSASPSSYKTRYKTSSVSSSSISIMCTRNKPRLFPESYGIIYTFFCDVNTQLHRRLRLRIIIVSNCECCDLHWYRVSGDKTHNTHDTICTVFQITYCFI